MRLTIYIIINPKYLKCSAGYWICFSFLGALSLIEVEGFFFVLSDERISFLVFLLFTISPIVLVNRRLVGN